ncbi:hypothetical protein FrCorBMG51_17285 [Protofrankia coriariae]|uniref:Uncharacterized protein n=1 Tax=Protofrankia coriariae TaxID=1562887 RepID=A0ABR5F1I2_9ACTN|nr:hypothetical protein [Protofrankia coriariae]KLL10527.1 hypothetical protein FrCorBMG51_17285 [Protofrankia coriariae]
MPARRLVPGGVTPGPGPGRVGGDDVETVVEQRGRAGRPTVQQGAQLTQVLTGWNDGRRLGRREPAQVSPAHLVEPQHPADGLEDLRRCCRPALLQPGVPGQADSGQGREFLAAQPPAAPAPTGGQPDAGRFDQHAVRAQAGPELAAPGGRRGGPGCHFYWHHQQAPGPRTRSRPFWTS